ncbi:MAG: HEAT repeat domain-containing protein [Planctomycetota bacterium]
MTTKRPLVLLLAPLGLLLACTTPPEQIRRERLAGIAREEVQRVANPNVTLEALGDPDPGLRRRAALALGRLRQGRYVPPLETLLRVESDPTVVEEAVFALGQIGSAAPISTLKRKLNDRDPWIRSLVIEALGKIQDDSVTQDILAYLTDPSERVRVATVLALYRLGARHFAVRRSQAEAVYESRTLALARAVRDQSAEVRWTALYALAGIADRVGRQAQLEGLGDSDWRCRLFAAQGLCRLGPEPATLDRLFAALDDSDYRVIVEVLKGLAGFVRDVGLDDERIAAAASARLVGESRHPSFHVRAAAADLLGLLGSRKDVAVPALLAALDDLSATVQGQALLALARLDVEAARPSIERFSTADFYHLRVQAVRAMALLPAEEALGKLERCVGDRDVRVVTAALEMLNTLGGANVAVRNLLLESLLRDDVAVRTTAAAGLAGCARPEDIDQLKVALARSKGPEGIEARQQILRTLAAAGGVEVTQVLQQALADEAYAVRQLAARELERLTGIAQRIEPAELATTLDPMAAAKSSPDDPDPIAVVNTTKGAIAIGLFQDEAPLHVKTFLERMRQGQHNGLIFHRVESNWVVQGLDPRGDGWGTGGLQLPDELNRRPYVRGAVGMPNSGPDTGGCQLFITLVPAPRLEGSRLQHGYTVFGQVLLGLDVLDQLEIGDVVEWVRPAPEVMKELNAGSLQLEPPHGNLPR